MEYSQINMIKLLFILMLVAGQAWGAVLPAEAPVWTASTNYVIGAKVFPTVATALNNTTSLKIYTAQAACASGSSEPAWDTTENNLTADNTCSWKARTAYWVDPTYSGGNGASDGSQLRPYTSWSSLSGACSLGRAGFQKRGTTATAQWAFMSSGQTSEKINQCISAAYGDSTLAAPIITTTSDPVINLNSTGNVIIADFEVTGSNGHGISIGVSSVANSEDNVELRRLNVHHNVGHGFTTYRASGSSSIVLTGLKIENSEFAYNGIHGISLINIDGALVKNNVVHHNGLTTAAWGIGAYANYTTHISGWSLVSGTVYNKDVGTETVLDVVSTVHPVSPRFLTNGTFGALGSNEWAQSGTTLQINIGANPNSGYTLFSQNELIRNIILEGNEAHSNNDASGNDGDGIGFDTFVNDSQAIRNYSHNNERSGFVSHITRNVKFLGNISRNNDLSEFTSNICTGMILYNNTFLGTDGLNNFTDYCPNAAVGSSYRNNLYVNGIVNFSGLPVTVSNNNGYYNNTSWKWNGSNYTTYASWLVASSNDALSVNASPAWIGGTSPTTAAGFQLKPTSPLIGTGTYLGRIPDKYGTLFKQPTVDIGAHSYTQSTDISVETRN
jgi:hypothetical protein